jgi:hypothetical protein
MDKLSQYIPILVILISFIISIIGKKKKQQAVTQKTTLPGTTLSEDVNKRVVPQTVTEPYQRPLQKVVEEKPKTPVFQKPVTKTVKEPASLSRMPVALESGEEEKFPFIFEGEDAARAVIYAEIINRKEW